MKARDHFIILLLFIFPTPILHLFSQSVPDGPCPAAPTIVRSTRPNIFSEQQENDLGDAIAEEYEHGYRVIRGPLNDYLQSIGDKLLQQLPPTQLKFRFVLVDLPDVNAFTSAGGHIYVTRKMILEVRSEDELAGVMGHEIGHAMARDPSVYITLLFNKVLNINSVGDRKDIFEKWNQVLETI